MTIHYIPEALERELEPGMSGQRQILGMVRVVRTKEGKAILLQSSIVPPERQKLHIHTEGDENGISPLADLGRRIPVSR